MFGVVQQQLADLQRNQTDATFIMLPHVSFYQPAAASDFATKILGITALLSWVKLLSFLGAFPYLAMLSCTITNASYDIVVSTHITHC